MMRRRTVIGLLSLCSMAAFAWSGAVFAQQTSSTPTTMEDLQKQIQQLLGQMQTLQQQVVTLKSELDTRPAPSPTPTPQVSTESQRKLKLIGDAVVEEEEGDDEEEEELFMAPEITRVLARGSRGEDVRRLQEFLAHDPSVYPGGLITGYFGVGTEAAVRRWQAKNDLTPVGIVGRRTIAKFREINENLPEDFREPQEEQEEQEDIRTQTDTLQNRIRQLRLPTRTPLRVPVSPTERVRPITNRDGTEICPALPTVNSCPAGQERVIAHSSQSCGVYYSCQPRSEYHPPILATTTSTNMVVFPYRFSNNATASNFEMARAYCVASGPGTGQGISAECEAKFGVVYPMTQTQTNTQTTSSTSSPVSYSSVCDSALIALLGTGCHQMHSDSSGNPVFCDGPMTKSAKRGDAAATAGCAGYTTTTGTTTIPAGQKEQIWNSLGLRSWIRTDAPLTRIESLKQSCANVSNGANIWMPDAGNATSADFGMPNPDKCRLAAACTSSQYFDGAACVSGSSTSGGYTYAGDANSCPGFAYSRWDSTGRRYCQLNTVRACDYTYPSYLTNGTNYKAESCPASDSTSYGGNTASSTSSACSSLGYDWSVYGNYCLNGSRTQYTPLSSPAYSSVQSCTGADAPVSGCTPPGSGTSSTTSCSQYGTGWHTMSSDGNCYDSAMQNYRTTNGTLYACSAVHASGCSGSSTGGSCASGQYWNGSSCVANTTSTCSSGQYWNGTSCVANTTTSCSQYGSGWHTMNSDGNCYDSEMRNYRVANGTLYSCSAIPASGCTSTPSGSSCASGQYWNGTSCVSSTSSTSCSSGQYWDGSACVANPTPTPSSTSCPSGQYWNGTACATSTSGASIGSAVDLTRIQKILRSLSNAIRSLKNSGSR